MRIVVDTNVFTGAAPKELSWPGSVIRWLDKFDGLLKKSVTEQEVFAVLQRPRIADDVTPLYALRLRRIFGAAELVTITLPVRACRDPKDEIPRTGGQWSRRCHCLRRHGFAYPRYLPGNPVYYARRLRSRPSALRQATSHGNAAVFSFRPWRIFQYVKLERVQSLLADSLRLPSINMIGEVGCPLAVAAFFSSIRFFAFSPI